MRALSLVTAFLGVGLVSAAFLAGKLFWPAAVLALFFIFWMTAFFRRWEWIHTPGLFLLFGFAAAGLLLNLQPALLYPGALLTLAGWDLADFAARIGRAGEADVTGLQSSHFIRLGLALAAATGILVLALNLHFQLSFGWAVFLVVLAALGLGRLVSRLLKKG